MSLSCASGDGGESRSTAEFSLRHKAETEARLALPFCRAGSAPFASLKYSRPSVTVLRLFFPSLAVAAGAVWLTSAEGNAAAVEKSPQRGPSVTAFYNDTCAKC